MAFWLLRSKGPRSVSPAPSAPGPATLPSPLSRPSTQGDSTVILAYPDRRSFFALVDELTREVVAEAYHDHPALVAATCPPPTPALPRPEEEESLQQPPPQHGEALSANDDGAAAGNASSVGGADLDKIMADARLSAGKALGAADRASTPVPSTLLSPPAAAASVIAAPTTTPDVASPEARFESAAVCAQEVTSRVLAEVKSFSRPPNSVLRIMRALLALLLPNKVATLRKQQGGDWESVRSLIFRLGAGGVKRLIEDPAQIVARLTPEACKSAEDDIEGIELDTAQRESPACATLLAFLRLALERYDRSPTSNS